MKINVNALRRYSTRSISVGYVMRDNHTKSLARGKQSSDCLILVTECLIAGKAVLIPIKIIFRGLLFKVIPSWL